jgi:spermidine synthase
MQALGRHVLVEFFECSSDILNDVASIEKNMVNAATEAGATIINSTFHHFSPFGVSGVVVIQESHLAVHTWPEYRYAAVDLFTCGEPVDPWISYNYLKQAFQAVHGSSMEIRRGQLNLLTKVEIDLAKMRDEAGKELRLPQFTRNIWFTERGNNIALSLRHKGDPLFRKQSPFQKVEIYDTYQYGKMLTCDGMIMCAEQDEHVYHEMITHVAMFTHPNPRRILVIGGGDGGAVRELVRHHNAEQIVMVEIDEVVIEASKQHLPELASAMNHPKLELIIDDGIKYVRSCTDHSFDIVIVDSTDPVGPAEGLFSETFYRDVDRVLDKEGILITQSESPHFNIKVFKEIFQLYGTIFGPENSHCYLAYIPTYPSGMWSFSFSSKGSVHPLRNLDDNRARKFSLQQNLRYYSDEVHRAAFVLPRFVQDILA